MGARGVEEAARRRPSTRGNEREGMGEAQGGALVMEAKEGRARTERIVCPTG